METTFEFNMNANHKKWIYFVRQLLVCSGVWTTFFMVGQFVGAPTVFVPQLRKETVFVPQLRKDSSVQLDEEMASWMYSVFGFGAAPWALILPMLSRRYGLRIPYIIACIDLLVAYLVFYFSSSLWQILASEIALGLGHASMLTIGIVIISEYTSPEYRGMFLTIKAASMFWGLLSSNTIGTFFHWKSIAYSGFICSAYTFTFVFWPESPQWLARRGKFDECRKAFYWLQGHSEKTEKEVEDLIASRVKAAKLASLNNDWSTVSDVIRTVASKEFYAPLLLIVLLVTQYHFAGHSVCLIYILDILKEMTANESAAYTGMSILDGVMLFSMYFGCFLSKMLNRRTLYLTTSGIVVSFLFIISLYLYLVKLSLIEESKVLSMALLISFSVAMACGPMILNTSLYAEIIPLRFKSVLVLIAALLFYMYYTALLKVAPYFFKSLGLHGTFLFYGITCGVCTGLLYKYLPETKDKTLLEIEENFKDHELTSVTEHLRK